LLVVVESGSIVQISIGTVVSAAYLVRMQSHSVWYQHITHACGHLAWTDGAIAGPTLRQSL
jgi:hypothetical protein